MHTLRVYFAFLSASLRSQMSYRRSFLLELVGRFALTGLELVPIFFVFAQLDDLAGWSRWEVVYLYGVASLAMAVGETATSGIRDMQQMVRNGDFDRVLLRPAAPLVQVLGLSARLHTVGRLVQGAIALGAAVALLPMDWSASNLLLLGLTIASGAVLYAALFIAGGAQCFWTTQSTEFLNAFTYGGVTMSQLPITIYRPWLRSLFLFVIPVGFVSYVPSVVVLGKTDPLGIPAYAAYLTPVISLAFLGGVLLIWRLGTLRYQSTGS